MLGNAYCKNIGCSQRTIAVDEFLLSGLRDFFFLKLVWKSYHYCACICSNSCKLVTKFFRERLLPVRLHEKLHILSQLYSCIYIYSVLRRLHIVAIHSG